MASNPKPRYGLDRRTQAQRKREWKREMEALTPAERAVWEQLPYSTIPVPGHARDIVAAVRPIIAAETLHQAADRLDGGRMGRVKVSYGYIAGWLRRHADEEWGNTDA